MKKIMFMVISLAAYAINTTTFAQGPKMAGGSAMYPSKDIVDNAVNSKSNGRHSENKAMLIKILTYHAISGRFSPKDIAKAVKACKGTAEFKTVSGGIISGRMNGKKLILKDQTPTTAGLRLADAFKRML